MPAARTSTPPVSAAPLKLAFRLVNDELAQIICDGTPLEPIDRRDLLVIASRSQNFAVDLPEDHPGSVLVFRGGSAQVHDAAHQVISRIGPDQVAGKLMAAAPVHPQRNRIALAGYGLRFDARLPVQLVDPGLPLGDRLRRSQHLALLGYSGPVRGFGELVLGDAPPAASRLLAVVPGAGLQALERTGDRWRRFVPEPDQGRDHAVPVVIQGGFQTLGWFRQLPSSEAARL